MYSTDSGTVAIHMIVIPNGQILFFERARNRENPVSPAVHNRLCTMFVWHFFCNSHVLALPHSCLLKLSVIYMIQGAKCRYCTAHAYLQDSFGVLSFSKHSTQRSVWCKRSR